ncbi:MAG TPA: helix-turn-helix domain-containing protein [Sandaracinaceae bacterium]
MQRPEAPCEHGERAPLSVAPAPVIERAASLLKAVGDPGRLRLLERLALGGEQCVTELAAACGEGLSTVSQRLRLLRAEQLVTRRREGKHVYYALADVHVKELIFAALHHAAEPRAHEPQGDDE